MLLHPGFWFRLNLHCSQFLRADSEFFNSSLSGFCSGIRFASSDSLFNSAYFWNFLSIFLFALFFPLNATCMPFLLELRGFICTLFGYWDAKELPKLMVSSCFVLCSFERRLHEQWVYPWAIEPGFVWICSIHFIWFCCYFFSG